MQVLGRSEQVLGGGCFLQVLCGRFQLVPFCGAGSRRRALTIFESLLSSRAGLRRVDKQRLHEFRGNHG